MNLHPYLKIARIDHFVKNVFVLPGVFVALYAEPELISRNMFWNLIVALIVAAFIASSNYVINEILDSPQDAVHPVKKNRPIPSGEVELKIAYVEWMLLGAFGILISLSLNKAFFYTTLAFLVMGNAYNVPPLRTKDKPYLDVLSESINNPLRFLLGWYCTGIKALPPISLISAYWMVGAFFMSVKRFAEYRRINNKDIAVEYRNSFRHYNEERLLVSIIYYGCAFGLFFGIFLLRYRMELILAVPFVAGFISWYIHLGLKPDSPTQYPERLYKEKGFVAYSFVCLAFFIALFFMDVPILREIFAPTIAVQNNPSY